MPALWACTVGDSGTGKSPSARPTDRLAFDIDTRMKRRYLAEVAQHVAAMAAWNALEVKDPATRPVKPVREHFAVVDCTIERLAEVLGHSRRGVVMVRDELDG